MLVSVSESASQLPPGGYLTRISFLNTTNHRGDSVRSADLSVGQKDGALTISPYGIRGITGFIDWEFNTKQFDYILSNEHHTARAIEWTAASDDARITLSPSSGTLAGGGTQIEDVNIASEPADFEMGSSEATLTFTNTTNGTGSGKRNINVRVACIRDGASVRVQNSVTSMLKRTDWACRIGV